MVLALWVPTLPGSPLQVLVSGGRGIEVPCRRHPSPRLSPGPASVVTLGVCRARLLARCPVLGSALRSGR